MAHVATAAEVAGAQAFLKYLGADYRNKYLILAVVAWMHQESGGIQNVIGNNPFNIRPGIASKWASGTRKGRVGSFLIFPNIETGFRAAALVLKSLAPAYGYGLVVAAARRGDAVDFLAALAMSSWSASHYGWDKGENPADPKNNNLLRVYAGFTGLQMPAPTPKPKPKPKPRPKYPRVLQPPPPPRKWVSGFAAAAFYRERHPRS